MPGPKMPEMDVPIEPEEGGLPDEEKITEEGGLVEEEDGYQIVIKVRRGNMTVCKKPLNDEPDADDAAPSSMPEYEEIPVDNIEQALKASFKIHKDNPVDNSEDAHMEASYNTGKAEPPMTQGAY